MHLSDEDFRQLEDCYISRTYAEAAGIWRASTHEGRERVGRNGAGDYAGWVFPYLDPATGHTVGERLRLDHPPVDHRGRPLGKYLAPPGQRNRFYWPLAEMEWIDDVTLPVFFTEGEKKYLAAHRAAMESGKDGRPLFLVIALSGVNCWRGVIGAASGKSGKRVPVKGVIPDFDRVPWTGRRVIIGFDSNATTNDQVGRARGQLARELTSRQAEVSLLEVPSESNNVKINGIDDYLAAAGLEAFLDLYRAARGWDWHRELQRTANNKIQANISKNAAIALRLAPEFRDVLVWNLFAERAEIRRPPPWKSPPGPWRDLDIVRLREWLETQGILESRQNVIDAVVSVASETPFHPIREYLESLEWDGVGRLNNWLAVYAGAAETDFIRAVGAKWLISAIARVEGPGCKADHMLVFEGPQGRGKSRMLRILAGEFLVDDMPDLAGKDAQLALATAWIVEFAEMDAPGRAEASRTKSFLSRNVDHYRAPYGRLIEDHPRHCVFAGTTNTTDYGNDSTGLRRYWPVACGEIKLGLLERDRDQLWAEALERYRNGESWWFEDQRTIEAAGEEQAARQQGDAWTALVSAWLFARPEPVTTGEVLAGALKKEAGQWTRADEMRVGAILTRLGRVRVYRRIRGTSDRDYFYCEPDETKEEQA